MDMKKRMRDDDPCALSETKDLQTGVASPSSSCASALGGIALAQAMSATMVNVRYMVDDVDFVMSAAWQVLTTYGLIPPTAGGPYEDAMGNDLRCCAAADRLRRGAGAGPGRRD
jgi:hypothetical protein